MTTQSAVEVCEISHKFGNRTVLDNVSFKVDKGEIFALLGPNGSGKSTLFRILSTQLFPTSGDGIVEGISIKGAAGDVRKNLGVVFQSPGIDKKLTVNENLMHQGHLYGLYGKYLKTRIEHVLFLTDLVKRRNDQVGKLSGGMQKRVEIGKAILHEPSVLLLDEPTAALDPLIRSEIMAILQDMSREANLTSLITTHLLDEAEKVNRIAILDQGRLMACGTPQGLKDNVGGEIVEILSPDVQRLRDIITEKLSGECRIIDGKLLRIETATLNGNVDGYQLVAGLTEKFPGIIHNARIGRPTLEDVFTHFSGRRYEDAPREVEQHG